MQKSCQRYEDAVETDSISTDRICGPAFGVSGGNLDWQGKGEGASFAGSGFDPDAAGIQFYDLLDDREADARATRLLAGRQRLEYPEDLFQVVLINPGPIVGHAELPEAVFIRRTPIPMLSFFLMVIGIFPDP